MIGDFDMEFPWVIKRSFRIIRKYIRRFRYTNWNKNQSYTYSSNKKTILVVSHSSREGGAPMLLNHIAHELVLKGYQVIIVTCDYGHMLYSFSKIGKVYVCLNKYDVNKLIRKICKKYNIEKCYFNSVMTGNLVKQFKKKGFHTVTLIHELPQAIKTLHAMKQAQNAAEYSDVLVFAANYIKEKFQELVLPSAILEKSVIQPQGIYQRIKADVNKDIAIKKICRTIGNISAGKIVLNVGEASYRKGFDIFVKLAEMDKDNTYIWVGYRENAFSKSVINKYKELPVNLQIVGYITDPDELYNYYFAADVFCLTSREEPFASVILEAFNAGLPVVAFANVGGADDVVKNGSTGYLANEISPHSLLNSIKMVTLRKDQYEIMSSTCKRIADGMSFSAYVDELLKL